MSEPIPDLAIRASVRLQRLAAKVIDRHPVRIGSLTFELEWLADPAALMAIEAELKAEVNRDDHMIYQFTAMDDAAYDGLTEAFAARPLTNTSGDLLKYSRMMAPAVPRALYVGSSSSFRSRIGQHLGRIGGAGTYSMRLALWATAVPATITLSYWSYDRDMNPIELEALEQELWDARTPLLGKRSGK